LENLASFVRAMDQVRETFLKGRPVRQSADVDPCKYHECEETMHCRITAWSGDGSQDHENSEIGDQLSSTNHPEAEGSILAIWSGQDVVLPFGNWIIFTGMASHAEAMS
jgi:hypothetical protein